MAQKSATIAIVKDNKVLLLKRGDTAPWMPNKYCLVGGGIDENESLIDAVIRESQEEIGVSIQKSLIESFVVTYKNNYSKTVFLTKVSDLNIRLNYEHSDHIWCDYDSCEKLYNQKLLVPRLFSVIKTLAAKKIIF